MQRNPSSASASSKPSLGRRILALFLVVAFAAAAGSVLFFAKNTQHDTPSVKEAQVEVKKQPETVAHLPGDPLSPDNMVAVETPEENAAAKTDNTENSTTPSASGDLQNQVTSLQMQLRDLEIKLSEKAGTAKAATALSETISSLQKDVLAMSERVASLEKIAINLQESTRKGLQNDVALVLGASQLQVALSSGAPYANSLDMVLKLAQGNNAIESALMPLKEAAEKGVDDAKTLQRDFATLSKNSAREEAKTRARDWAAGWAGEGFVADTFGQIGSLMVVRRTDAETGLDADIQKAETALAQGKFTAALDAVRSMPTSDALRDFQERLAAKAKAEEAIAQLQKLLLERLHNSAASSVNG